MEDMMYRILEEFQKIIVFIITAIAVVLITDFVFLYTGNGDILYSVLVLIFIFLFYNYLGDNCPKYVKTNCYYLQKGLIIGIIISLLSLIGLISSTKTIILEMYSLQNPSIKNGKLCGLNNGKEMCVKAYLDPNDISVTKSKIVLLKIAKLKPISGKIVYEQYKVRN